MIILKTIALLYFEFFKTGLFAMGGGLATIPFLREIAENYGWFSSDMLSNMIAISESTPGPLGVNMATYTGFSTMFDVAGTGWGIVGGITATAGLATPSVIIILIISRAYQKFRDNIYVSNAFYAVRPAVTGMIAAVAISLAGEALFDGGFTLDMSALASAFGIKSAVMFVVFLVLTHIKRVKNLHPIFFIIATGVIGGVFAM